MNKDLAVLLKYVDDPERLAHILSMSDLVDFMIGDQEDTPHILARLGLACVTRFEAQKEGEGAETYAEYKEVVVEMFINWLAENGQPV